MGLDFVITSCTAEDGPAIARNNVAAFWTDPSWVLLWPGKTREEITDNVILRQPATLLDSPSRRRHQKAVDMTTGKVVGYARWMLPQPGRSWFFSDTASPSDTMWPEARVPSVPETEMSKLYRQREAAPWSPSRAMQQIEAPMRRMEQSLEGAKDYMVLDILAVDPEYRGCGIGTSLLNSGLEAAGKMGFAVFITAFEAGLNLYRKAGCRVIDQIVLDDSSCGGTGRYATYFMVKDIEVPQGQHRE